MARISSAPSLGDGVYKLKYSGISESEVAQFLLFYHPRAVSEMIGRRAKKSAPTHLPKCVWGLSSSGDIWHRLAGIRDLIMRVRRGPNGPKSRVLNMYRYHRSIGFRRFHRWEWRWRRQPDKGIKHRGKQKFLGVVWCGVWGLSNLRVDVRNSRVLGKKNSLRGRCMQSLWQRTREIWIEISLSCQMILLFWI